MIANYVAYLLYSLVGKHKTNMVVENLNNLLLLIKPHNWLGVILCNVYFLAIYYTLILEAIITLTDMLSCLTQSVQALEIGYPSAIIVEGCGLELPANQG